MSFFEMCRVAYEMFRDRKSRGGYENPDIPQYEEHSRRDPSEPRPEQPSRELFREKLKPKEPT